MKTISIHHIRCGEWDASTYVLAPDDWDDNTINQKIQDAAKEYLVVLKQAKEDNPRPGNYYGPDWNSPKHLDKTVREVLAERTIEEEKIKKWEKRQRENRKQFSDFLADQGFTPLWKLDENLVFEVDWGHNHGLFIDYSETETDGFPSPAQVSGNDEGEDL